MGLDDMNRRRVSVMGLLQWHLRDHELFCYQWSSLSNPTNDLIFISSHSIFICSESDLLSPEAFCDTKTWPKSVSATWDIAADCMKRAYSASADPHAQSFMKGSASERHRGRDGLWSGWTVLMQACSTDEHDTLRTRWNLVVREPRRHLGDIEQDPGVSAERG